MCMHSLVVVFCGGKTLDVKESAEKLCFFLNLNKEKGREPFALFSSQILKGPITKWRPRFLASTPVRYWAVNLSETRS